MPRYDYKCKKCNTVFEKTFTLKEDNTQPLNEPCPSCGKEGDVVRVYETSNPTVVANVDGIKTDNGWKDVLRKIKSDHPKGYYGTSI